jgi:hypothetical protein
MGAAVVGEGEGLPGRIVGADLFRSGGGSPVGKAATTCFLLAGMGPAEQMSIFAEATDGVGVGGRRLRTV